MKNLCYFLDSNTCFLLMKKVSLFRLLIQKTLDGASAVRLFYIIQNNTYATVGAHTTNNDIIGKRPVKPFQKLRKFFKLASKF